MFVSFLFLFLCICIWISLLILYKIKLLFLLHYSNPIIKHYLLQKKLLQEFVSISFFHFGMCPGKLGWFRHIHLRQNLQILQSTIAVLKIVRYRMQNKEKTTKNTKQLIIIITSTEILRNRLAIFLSTHSQWIKTRHKNN